MDNEGARAERETMQTVVRMLVREAADQTCRTNRLLAEAERLLPASEDDGPVSPGAAPEQGPAQVRSGVEHSLPDRHVKELTERERQVLLLLLNGKPNRQIARHMGITERTVKNHLHSIFIKLGVSDRTSAVIKVLDDAGCETDVHDGRG